MGLTALIPDMTIGQLTFEATERWGEIWDPLATRMCILLILPRKERKMMELHGDMVEHGQPVMTVFHRPRGEAPLLEDQGFNPRDASFQFVDLATSDLGPWVQHLVTGEGWLRSSVELCSTPFSVGVPSQRPFETIRTLCFRHPSLPALEQYFLPFPPESLPGKCFVSLPRRAAAEMARQQAEVLGIGRLEKPKPAPEVEAIPPATIPEPAVTEQPSSAPEPTTPTVKPPVDEHVAVPLPPVPTPLVEAKRESAQSPPLPDEVANLQSARSSSADDEASAPPAHEPVALPEQVTESTDVDMSEAEREVRTFFTELIEAGVEPSAFMDDPRWEDINERALASSVEVWPILMQMVSMD